MALQTQRGLCALCRETGDVAWCGICQKWFCMSCRTNYPERLAAMVKELFTPTDAGGPTASAEEGCCAQTRNGG